MTAAAPPIPTLPGPDWAYAQALETEAAIRAYITEHGPSLEASLALATTMAGRCDYRAAVRVMEEEFARQTASGDHVFWLNGSLIAHGAALHGGMREVAERMIAGIAQHRTIITGDFAHAVARYARGTGLQPELRDILAHCASCIDPASPHAELVDILLREYEGALRIARAVRLVSLGAGCYPWLQANRTMLRLVGDTDNHMPFNMTVLGESGLIAALETSLAAFFDAGEYDLTTITRGIPVARLRRYATLFNHDCGDGFLANDMAELRTVLAARARTFLEHAVKGPRVLFCLIGSYEELHRLEAAVAGLMQDGAYRLLLVASQPGEPPSLPAPRLGTTRLVHVPMPHPGYNWTLEDHTPAGIRYDLAIRRTVLDVMRELA